MTLDEVYQAALAAGSGGIRYNDSRKRIQLMDENKNWIDWKYYDTSQEVQLAAISSSGGTLTHVFQKTGLYLACCGCQALSVTNVTTTATKTDLAYNVNTGSDRRRSLFAFYAHPDDTLTITYSRSSSYPFSVPLLYVGAMYTTVAIESVNSGGDTTVTNSFTDRTGVIILGISGGNNRNISYTCTSEDNISDGINYVLCSSLREQASASASVYGSSGGVATIYILQVS